MVEQRQRVRRGDILLLADDDVAVAIAVRRRRAEIGSILGHHPIIEVAGVDQIGVGMMPAEIGQGGAVHHRPRRSA